MPVGEGRFADLVAQALTERGYPVHREAGEGDNGWCLSLADASGERTFISMFGLERRMKPDWFERFDIESFDYFYVSGYQAEGENGRVILEALSRKRPDAVVVFDPGPRVHFMPRRARRGLLPPRLPLHRQRRRGPLHDGHDPGRGCRVAPARHVGARCRRYRRRPRRDRGRQRQRAPHPGFPVAIVDTIGSGDAHTGGVIAGLMCGLPIDECVLLANRVASVVTAARAAPARPRSTSSSPSTADVQGPSFPFKSTAPPGLPLGRTGNFIPSSRKDNQHERQLLRLRH